MYKRSLYFLTASVFLALFFLVWGMGYLFEFGVVTYLEKRLDGHVKYERVEHKGNDLIFHNLHIEDKRGRKISASTLSLRYDFSPFSRVLSLTLSAEKPELFLPKNISLLPSLFFMEEEASSWIHLQASFSVEEALIATPQFQFTASLQGAVAGGSTAFQFSSKDKENSLLLRGFLNEKGQKIEVTAATFPLDRLLTFVRKLPGTTLDELKGILNGQVLFTNSEEGFAVKGALALEELAINTPTSKWKNSRIDVDFEGGMTKGTMVLSLPLHFQLLGEKGPVTGNLTGAIQWVEKEKLSFTFNLDSAQKMALMGEIAFSSTAGWHIGMKAISQEGTVEAERPAYIFYWGKDSELREKVNLQVVRGDPKDMSLFQDFATFFIGVPTLYNWDNGRFQGELEAIRQGGEWLQISGKAIQLENFAIQFPQYESAFSAKKVAGSFSYDPRIFDMSAAVKFDLHVDEGELQLLPMGRWGLFRNINADIALKNGSLESTGANLIFAGLRGTLTLQSGGAILSLQGFGHEIADLLPPKLGEVMRRNSSDDFLKVTLSAEEVPRGLLWTGAGELLRKGVKKENFDFGFLLSFRKEARFSQEEIVERNRILSQNSPSLPGLALFSRSWDREMVEGTDSIGGFQIDGGWVNWQQFDLQALLSPYIFQKNEMILSGIADLEAIFDDHHMIMEYGGKGIRLESHKVLITLPETEKKGYHFVDFVSGHHEGKLHLAKGAFVDKNYGLQFSDIDGTVTFNDKKIFLDSLSGYSGSLYMEADVLVDLSDPREGVFDVSLFSALAQGEVARAREILLQIDPTLSYGEIPLEGGVGLRGNGGELSFHVEPEGFTWNGRLSGTIFDARLSVPLIPHALFGINFNFDYDRAKKRFLISELSAEAYAEGDPSNVFQINAKQIGFSDEEEQKALFDIQVNHQEEPFFSIAAEGTRVKKEGQETIVWSFNEDAVRFGALKPKGLSISTRGFDRLDSVYFESAFRLSDLIHELSRFSQTGFLFLSKDLLAPLFSLNPVSGDLKVAFGFNGEDHRFSYNLQGETLSLGDKSYKKLDIAGYFGEGKWHFDSIDLDDLGLSFTLENLGDSYFIKPFALHLGKSMVFGGEGIFNLKGSSFDANLDLLQANLEEVQAKNWLPSELLGHALSGQLRGKGKLYAEKKSEEWHLSGELLADIKDGVFDSHPIHFKKPFFIEINEAHELFCKELECTVTFSDIDKDSSISFAIPAFHYDPRSEEKVVDKILFSTKENFAFLTKILFPAINKNDLEQVEKVKRVGGVSGTATIHICGEEKNFRVILDQGPYQIYKEEVAFGPLILENEKERWKIRSTLVPEDPIHIEAITGEKSFLPLEVALYENEEGERLAVHLLKEGDKYFVHAEGGTRGIYLDLYNVDPPLDSSGYLFEGQLRCNFHEAKRWFSRPLLEKIEALGLGSGYLLKGHLFIPSSENPIEGEYTFTGSLIGEEALIKGVFVDYFHGEIVISKGKVEINNLQGIDPAFLFQIPIVRLTKQEEFWFLQLPRFEMTDLRPSLLYREGAPRSEEPSTPLFIEYLVVDNLSGYLDPVESLQATGSLHFTNQKKNNLRNTIFVLPAEILSRIGIDMAALTPVRGTMFFTINDGLVHFTKFKEMYSYGKLSKFYLPGGRDATMDFAGNLSLEIKMRQHTLLFKLAELLTFSVRGNLENPIYSISHGKNSKQRSMEKEISE